MRLLGQTTAQLASWWPGWAQLRAAPPRPPHPSSDLGHGPARRPARPAPARDRHGHRTRSTFIKCNQKIFYSKDKILFVPRRCVGWPCRLWMCEVVCVRGTAEPWRGAGAGGRYANIVRNFHVKNLQSGGGQAEPCHPAPATILSRDFQPAAQHRLLGGRGGGGGGVQGGDWRL